MPPFHVSQIIIFFPNDNTQRYIQPLLSIMKCTLCRFNFTGILSQHEVCSLFMRWWQRQPAIWPIAWYYHLLVLKALVIFNDQLMSH